MKDTKPQNDPTNTSTETHPPDGHILGLRTLVESETRVRSGCPKTTTSSCGINYRAS